MLYACLFPLIVIDAYLTPVIHAYISEFVGGFDDQFLKNVKVCVGAQVDPLMLIESSFRRVIFVFIIVVHYRVCELTSLATRFCWKNLSQ